MKTLKALTFAAAQPAKKIPSPFDAQSSSIGLSSKNCSRKTHSTFVWCSDG